MIRHASRPRAPSPPRQNSSSPTTSFIYSTHNESDNTYSVVQDSVILSSSPPPPPPKRRHQGEGRMFGDSVTASPSGSVLSSSKPPAPPVTHHKSSLTRPSSRVDDGNESLHHLYHLKNHGPGGGIYDGATVEEIKAQFQKQIENMLQGGGGGGGGAGRQERNPLPSSSNNNTPHPLQPGQLPPKGGISGSLPQKLPPPHPPQQQQHQHHSVAVSNNQVRKSHIPSSGERELSDIRDLQREKSFFEARSAVQKQIERIFSDASTTNHPKEIKHTMHGVSHALPGQDKDFPPPPPVHYGVNQTVIQNGSAALRSKKNNTEEISKWRSVESVLNSNGDHLYGQDPFQSSSALSQSKSNKNHRSMESVHHEIKSRAPLGLGLKRTNAVDIDIGDPDLTERLRSFEQSNDKPKELSPNPSLGRDNKTFALNASPQQPAPSPKKAQQKEYVKHKVDYLGALPISNRSTNLATLQEPLKDLYFKYRALRNLGQSNLPGTLEINDTGLTIQYIRELHKGVQEIFNPFPTIAVWAAVKFVHKREVTQFGTMHHRFAFLPLISDPDGQEKNKLFHDLEMNEVELAADSPHPPVFACVMRRTGAPKKLECHGFVCTSSEDAIIVAANLYQALLETMKKQRRRSKSRTSTNPDDITPPPTIFSDSDTTTPIRPPRTKRKKSGRSGTAESSLSSKTSLINQRRRSVRSSIRSNRSNRSVRSNHKGPSVSYDPTGKGRLGGGGGGGLSRSDSSRRSIRSNASRQDPFRRSTRARSSRRTTPAFSFPPTSVASTYGLTEPGTDRGDVYTKVAIPRSKSFMNVNSQYNLQELFRELKEKEGVESIDDVLKKVITPNGISFNEIKPVYRELLMKLAMTMSQDELFQRSKSILTQEKKKSQKKSGKKSKSSSVVGSEQNTLSSFLRMTFSGGNKNSNNNNSNNNTSNSKSSSQVDKNNQRNNKNPLSLSTPSLNEGSPHSSWRKSSSGYDSASPHNRSFMSGTIGNSSNALSKSHSTIGKISKADISGPIPILNQSPLNTTTPTSHGKSYSSGSKLKPFQVSKIEEDDSVDDAYMSCSECGYESVCTYDTCSCREKVPPSKAYQAGPVYSAQNGPFAPLHGRINKPLPNIPEPSKSAEPESDVYCDDCDGESCISDDKCYCSLRGHPEMSTPTKSRASLHPRHDNNGTGPCHHEDVAIVSHLRLPNNTTIIHCNGSDTLRSQHAHSTVSSTSSTTSSQCSSCMTCDSGSTATDTTCYSIKHQQISLSTCDTPQTAWRRNNIRILHQQNSPNGVHKMLTCSDRSTCSDYSTESPLSRKNSGGSGYHSNDSLSGPHPGRLFVSNPAKATRVGSKAPSMCGSSSCSSSGTSSCSQRSFSTDGQKSASKVLLVSAVDRQGKVLYRGASNSNLDTIHSRDSNSHPEDKKSILSMKKSAEIAAVFSGARINQTTNIVDNVDSDLDSTDLVYDSKRPASNGSNGSCSCGNSNFSRANLQSSLGYFP